MKEIDFSNYTKQDLIQIVKNWIVELRSGNYKQTKYQLFDIKNDSYCCIGVLQKTQFGGISNKIYASREYAYKNVTELINRIFQNTKIHNWLTLSELNDFYEQDFNEIANYLENELKKI